jgi:hypothetical protein
VQELSNSRQYRTGSTTKLHSQIIFNGAMMYYRGVLNLKLCRTSAKAMTPQAPPAAACPGPPIAAATCSGGWFFFLFFFLIGGFIFFLATQERRKDRDDVGVPPSFYIKHPKKSLTELLRSRLDP